MSYRFSFEHLSLVDGKVLCEKTNSCPVVNFVDQISENYQSLVKLTAVLSGGLASGLQVSLLTSNPDEDSFVLKGRKELMDDDSFNVDRHPVVKERLSSWIEALSQAHLIR